MSSRTALEDRTTIARQRAIDIKISELYEWYLSNNLQIPPDTLCEDAKSYRGIVIRYFDPPIKDIDNYVLIEEYVGDSWTLRFDPRAK